MGPQCNYISQSLDHGGRYPDAHILLSIETGHVLRPGFENCEYWEDELFANQIPEFWWEFMTTDLQSAEEGVQSSERDPISDWGRKPCLLTHILRTSRSSPFMMISKKLNSIGNQYLIIGSSNFATCSGRSQLSPHSWLSNIC